MAVQFGTNTRNARLDAIETNAGASAVLTIRTGAQPADCQTANSGTLLVSIPLPSDYFSAASAGSKAKLGTWSNVASGTGTAAHFRIHNSGGTECIMQGTVATSGGDMNVDNTSIASSQTVTVTSFTITDGNA